MGACLTQPRGMMADLLLLSPCYRHSRSATMNRLAVMPGILFSGFFWVL
jgi:hypothetical protein